MKTELILVGKTVNKHFVEGGIKEQTRQSLTNAQNILKAAGTDLSHVVKTTVYLNSMDDFAAMNEVYAEFFSQYSCPAS